MDAKVSTFIYCLGTTNLEGKDAPINAMGVLPVLTPEFIPVSYTHLLKVEYNVKPKLAGFKKAETMFLVGQDSSTGRIDMSEPGSRLPQVNPVQEIPAAAYEEVSPGRRADPETGEIFEERRTGPIDLRRQQA